MKDKTQLYRIIMRIEEKACGLTTIPANEQHICHFQMAMYDLVMELKEAIKELAKEETHG